MLAEEIIRRRLFDVLSDGNIGLPIAWPLQTFTPPNDLWYIAPTFIRNGAERICIGSEDPHRIFGLLQIDIHAPKMPATPTTPYGEAAMLSVAEQVVALYPCDSTIYSNGLKIRVTKRPDVAAIMLDGDQLYLPVTVNWETFA